MKAGANKLLKKQLATAEKDVLWSACDARRDKKDFLNNQCKEIEENNRMGKTRDLFKKMRDTKGTCKDAHNKGQKWYGPFRRQEYTEEIYKKIFMTQITTTM